MHLSFHALLFSLKKKNAVQTVENICAVYADGAITERTVCKWFIKLRSRNFDLEKRERSSRSAAVDQNAD